MKVVHLHPIEWYVDRLKSGRAMASMLYGDGEFFVAMRERTKEELQCGEVVTRQMEMAMLDSFDNTDERIIRGTDPNLINYDAYQGQDKDSLVAIGRRIEHFLAGRSLEWVDGVVWENSVRAGTFGPFLRALQDRSVVMVGNRALLDATRFLRPRYHVEITPTNAYAMMSGVEKNLRLEHNRSRCKDTVYVFCMGLGAVPLIHRLLPVFPGASFFDLGSVLDIFARIGDQRRWRAELYEDETAYQYLVKRNLEGVL